MATPSIATAPAAGTYPTGRAGVSRAWDGQAWSGPAVADPDAPDFVWHRRPWAVPAHPLFWLTLVSIIVGCALAALYLSSKATPALWAAGLVGTGGPMVAFVVYVTRRTALRQTIATGPWVLWAVIGAAVALPFAYFVEGALPLQGAWEGLAGPIEEVGKLLVPVALFLLGRYRDPRAGLALALGVGALFGVVEGIEYVALAPESGLRVHHPDPVAHALSEYSPVIMVLQRAFMELVHPMLVGFVVSVAWRYARVKGHFWLPLAGAWAAAAILHALIDSAVGERSQVNSSLAAAAVVGAVVIVILIYPLVFRRAAAQLPPPDALESNPPPWRPRIPPQGQGRQA